MTCKCKATTYRGHLKKVQQDGYPAHVYTGHYWAPKDDAEADQHGNSTVPDGGWDEYTKSMQRS